FMRRSPRSSGRPLLPEAQDVAVGVPDRELLHAIRLNDQWINHLSALQAKLRVQRLDVIDPEEDIPRPSLPLVRADQAGLLRAAKHDGAAVSAVEGELGRLPGRVFALKSEHVVIVGSDARHVRDREVSGAAYELG